jgi:hypothetical protein
MPNQALVGAVAPADCVFVMNILLALVHSDTDATVLAQTLGGVLFPQRRVALLFSGL